LIPHLKAWVEVLASGIEIAAAILIGIAAVEAFARTIQVVIQRPEDPHAKERIRLRLGRWLTLALEFLLAADILATAVAPTWDEIGKLGAIIVLRTVLNFFLDIEMEKAERRESGV